MPQFTLYRLCLEPGRRESSQHCESEAASAVLRAIVDSERSLSPSRGQRVASVRGAEGVTQLDGSDQGTMEPRLRSGGRHEMRFN